jgi:hypothetical protein
LNRTKRFIALFATILGLAAMSALSSSPAIAATASPGAPAVAPFSVSPRDPNPGPPWVFSGYTFTSESACEATGRAFVNSGQYSDYTCRYQGGIYRLYLLPYILIGG